MNLDYRLNTRGRARSGVPTLPIEIPVVTSSMRDPEVSDSALLYMANQSDNGTDTDIFESKISVPPRPFAPSCQNPRVLRA